MYEAETAHSLEDTGTMILVTEDVWDEMQGPVEVSIEVLDSDLKDLIRAVSDLQQGIEERIDACEVIPWELRIDVWGGIVEFDPRRDCPRKLRAFAGRLSSDPSGTHPEVAEIVESLRRLAERVVELQ